MMTVTLEYRRDGASLTSSGRITVEHPELKAVGFTLLEQVPYREMIRQLAEQLGSLPPEAPVAVCIQRTDREGLAPYYLDSGTVGLLRTDPVAGIAALNPMESSPSGAVRRVRQERPKPRMPISVGQEVLAEAFGEELYFRVREHELECPGCGFWGMYSSPGLLHLEEREGAVMKTLFVCPKKCQRRLAVSCDRTWGTVRVEYLLEHTDLEAFYFPRTWNNGKPWVSRPALEKLFRAYKEEKEKVLCSVQKEV